jgi:hypothetical protein
MVRVGDHIPSGALPGSFDLATFQPALAFERLGATPRPGALG